MFANEGGKRITQHICFIYMCVYLKRFHFWFIYLPICCLFLFYFYSFLTSNVKACVSSFGIKQVRVCV